MPPLLFPSQFRAVDMLLILIGLQEVEMYQDGVPTNYMPLIRDSRISTKSCPQHITERADRISRTDH